MYRPREASIHLYRMAAPSHRCSSSAHSATNPVCHRLPTPPRSPATSPASLPFCDTTHLNLTHPKPLHAPEHPPALRGPPSPCVPPRNQLSHQLSHHPTFLCTTCLHGYQLQTDNAAPSTHRAQWMALGPASRAGILQVGKPGAFTILENELEKTPSLLCLQI